jgi:hypothetical protein
MGMLPSYSSKHFKKRKKKCTSNRKIQSDGDCKETWHLISIHKKYPHNATCGLSLHWICPIPEPFL